MGTPGNPADPTARTLALLSLVQTGREWAGPELAERLGISLRTLRRDITRLRELGYRIDTRSGPGGHYRLAAGATLPPLLFEDEEVVAIVSGMRIAEQHLEDRDAAARGRAKLEQFLPPRLRARAAATGIATEVVPSKIPPVAASLLGELADAAVASGRVRFGYRDRHDRESVRLVDPYRQVFSRGHWYLLGHDSDRADWRMFRLDRVSGIERVPGTYRRHPFPAETVAAYLDSNLAQPPLLVSVVFHAPARRMAGLLGHAHGDLEPLPGQRCRYVTRVDDLGWFAATTAVLGVPFQAERPAELAARCRELATVLSAGVAPDAVIQPETET